jgi:hypothetical protein
VSHIPEETSLQGHCNENLKSDIQYNMGAINSLVNELDKKSQEGSLSLNLGNSMQHIHL